MSIKNAGAGRVYRTTALPSNVSAFSACGYSYIDASQTGFGSIFELNKNDLAAAQINLGTAAGSTVLQIYVAWGAAENLSLYNPGTGAWFYWGIDQNGTTLSVGIALPGSTTWDATWSTNLANTWAPNNLSYGGAQDDSEYSKTRIARMGVWNVSKGLTFLLSQKNSLAVLDTSANLLSWHDADGADLTADLTADYGGSSANLTTQGSGTVYDSAYPTVVPPLTVTVSGSVQPVAVQSVALAGLTVTKGSTASVPVTVTGSDGAGFEGISVALTSATTSRVTVASSPQTTNSSGVATFTVSGVEVGTSALTANADSGAATATATATVSTTITVAALAIASPVVATVGGTTTVEVLAIGTNSSPMASVSVALTSSVTSVGTITSSPQTTGSNGIATFTLNGIAAGTTTLTASAASGAVTASTVATVSAASAGTLADSGSAWGRWLRGI